MKMHRETRETPVYGLVIGRGGLKLKDSPVDSPASGGEPPNRSVNAAMASGAGTTVTYGNGAYFTFGDKSV